MKRLWLVFIMPGMPLVYVPLIVCVLAIIVMASLFKMVKSR